MIRIVHTMTKIKWKRRSAADRRSRFSSVIFISYPRDAGGKPLRLVVVGAGPYPAARLTRAVARTPALDPVAGARSHGLGLGLGFTHGSLLLSLLDLALLLLRDPGDPAKLGRIRCGRSDSGAGPAETLSQAVTVTSADALGSPTPAGVRHRLPIGSRTCSCSYQGTYRRCCRTGTWRWSCDGSFQSIGPPQYEHWQKPRHEQSPLHEQTVFRVHPQGLAPLLARSWSSASFFAPRPAFGLFLPEILALIFLAIFISSSGSSSTSRGIWYRGHAWAGPAHAS
jgi:hypothetical protein